VQLPTVPETSELLLNVPSWAIVHVERAV
jgi:hypothetical protein